MANIKKNDSMPELYWFGVKIGYAGRLRDRNRSIIISYMALRQWIGWMGILLPLVCVLGGKVFAHLSCQSSISFYYHTNMRDYFCGILFAVSAFLITYKGENKIDNIVTNVIGLAGLAVALFPTADPASTVTQVGLFQVQPKLAGDIHAWAAGIFFLLLALNSMFLFTLSKYKVPPPGSRKKIRNRVYLSCGMIILACLALFIILGRVMPGDSFKEGNTVLFLEAIMLAAFGVSWLIKGETILKDVKRHAQRPRKGK